jgi:probable H4MPT-linked C1 transfer pathway protein
LKELFRGLTPPARHAASFVGLDIGGANLKAANAAGMARSEVFEIWRSPADLAERLREVLNHFAPVEQLAVTMTAELADCFATKAEGVDFILRQVDQAAGDIPAVVWLTSGRFAAPEEARRVPLEVAAANWHALATWAGRLSPSGDTILIDIGSTTTDVIPLRDGLPCPAGRTDLDRLLSGELVYTGVRRTPVCCVSTSVPLRGQECPLAAEWFATMGDVHLLLGDLPESPEDCHTANGRPATLACARDRLVRAICCDRSEVSDAELQEIARFLAEHQRSQISKSLMTVLERTSRPPGHVIVSGAGEFLARRIVTTHRQLDRCQISALATMLSPEATDAACAYAVAVLAAEGT